ncbi:oligopeptide/dipeptide ABC transporter ATP-binding protein [Proteiniclasticum sp. QWL-01]|uniref:ABC transporter ATP-binding protein n=1 Tax=Proteiniclasticum sp. QWL-01 TaxID=3036945 RepID=UPI002410C07E|nr:oligopeptide/dipeptide ABC transporter ATP-binding protein [Proteiniclasticum sp. QWL-01]WFF74128.1 ATP-binding cassette domain-containing protein [Proteiniclasticum sp. QWL-01]
MQNKPMNDVKNNQPETAAAGNSTDGKKLLFRLKDFTKYFPLKKSSIFQKEALFVRANEGVDLDIFEGETLGLVGESGCGKSTLGRTLLQLYPLTKGEILYYGDPEHPEGIDLAKLNRDQMRKYRKDLQIIFQDPYSSLNPRMTVGQIISEGLKANGIIEKDDEESQKYILDVMEKCGLQPYFVHRYPHQFSGGQRQRIGIARAVALNPKFIVADEPVSALDVSIQSQVINLLLDLKERHKLTYLFISHDLSVIKYISDRVGVMYLGNLVELTDTKELFANRLHPYTEALLSAIPTTDLKEKVEIKILEGDIPSPINPPAGCKFHTRCQFAQERCKTEVPELREIRPNHMVACHFPLLKQEDRAKTIDITLADEVQ